MPDAEFKSQLQAAQDMLDVLQEQRNANANQIVQMGGQLKAAQRRESTALKRVVELETKVAELEQALSDHDEPELPNITPQRPATNGHAEQAH